MDYSTLTNMELIKFADVHLENPLVSIPDEMAATLIRRLEVATQSNETLQRELNEAREIQANRARAICDIIDRDHGDV